MLKQLKLAYPNLINNYSLLPVMILLFIIITNLYFLEDSKLETCFDKTFDTKFCTRAREGFSDCYDLTSRKFLCLNALQGFKDCYEITKDINLCIHAKKNFKNCINKNQTPMQCIASHQ